MSDDRTMNERFDDPRDDPLCFRSVDELAAGYRAGTFSPIEVTDAVYARIGRINPRLVAYYELATPAAFAAARASEARHRARAALGALDGVPVSIKDHIDVAGMTSPRGGSLAGVARSTHDSPASPR